MDQRNNILHSIKSYRNKYLWYYTRKELHIGIHYDADPNDIILILYITKQLDERFN